MNQTLQQIADDYWEHRLRTFPTSALMMGDHRYGDRMERATRIDEDAVVGDLRAFASAAEQIDPAELTVDERISREVLLYVTRTEADDIESRRAELAVNPEVGFQAMLPVMVPQFPIVEPEHADQLVGKYEGIGRLFREMADRLRQGVASGRVPTAALAQKTVEQIDGLDVEAALTATRSPQSFGDAEAASWMERLVAAIRQHVVPGLQQFRDTIADEVVPVGRSLEEPGLCWLPGGEEAYARTVTRHTSLDKDPEEIHQIGLAQIDALAGEYRALGGEALGTSDLSEIFGRLRDDPTLHFDGGPPIVAASEQAMAKAKGAMADWFGTLPQSDCVVAETQTGPVAFYFRPADDGSRPGTFFVNTSDPSGWGTFEIEAMAYHEGIPGHHLQLAISQELEGVPDFRRHAFIAAYSEGWGLYTERLADEMGLYSGPLERMGMLSADSMRAGRLVVDTGLHAMGWSRQKAIDFMAENSPMAVGKIEGEIDRYIGMPGQALSYMLGRLEIQRLRSEAEDAMGEGFDIKRFHDVVLGSGLVPLPTLARLVREWAA